MYNLYCLVHKVGTEKCDHVQLLLLSTSSGWRWLCFCVYDVRQLCTDFYRKKNSFLFTVRGDDTNEHWPSPAGLVSLVKVRKPPLYSTVLSSLSLLFSCCCLLVAPPFFPPSFRYGKDKLYFCHWTTLLQCEIFSSAPHFSVITILLPFVPHTVIYMLFHMTFLHFIFCSAFQ